ncbi:MAG: hypothetical protein B7Z72_05505 [Gemmatimonadetes bacterium 21-71-4]|nr:MAG: hypothetical protein B7Z72_05505 [Gemmatimonadetes bacterium 21-71-4]
MSESVEFDIHAIAAGGDGVGRTDDGLVVFAARTAPGDHVRVSVERGKRFARAGRVAVLRPSSDRVTPVCPHYEGDGCGGCQLQHLSDNAQRLAKAGIIRDAFQRIAKRPMDLPPVVHGPSAWRYRTKLTLALRRAAGAWTVGLHRYDRADEVFPLDDCFITDRRVLDVWRAVRERTDLLPDAEALRASVRLVGDGAALVVEGGHAWTRARDLLEAVRALVAIWWIPDGARSRRRLVAERGAGQEHGASFAQVNAEVAELMRSHVLSLVRAHAPRRVVDAYAGAGDTAEPIARAGAAVVAIEWDRSASRVCAARLPSGSRAVADTVERALPGALPADLVLLNPPRGGLSVEVTRVLETSSPRPPALIYVSCDPATLARDVARLPSYRVASLIGFDMFPQTAHIETVCALQLETP